MCSVGFTALHGRHAEDVEASEQSKGIVGKKDRLMEGRWPYAGFRVNHYNTD